MICHGELIPCCPPLGEIPVNVSVSIHISKHVESGTKLQRNMANKSRQCSLAMLSEYMWHARDFSSPIKSLLFTHLIVLQHLNIDENKSCWTRAWSLKKTPTCCRFTCQHRLSIMIASMAKSIWNQIKALELHLPLVSAEGIILLALKCQNKQSSHQARYYRCSLQHLAHRHEHYE